MTRQIYVRKRSKRLQHLARKHAQKGDNARAVQTFHKALEFTPDDYFCHHCAAISLQALGQKEQALEHWLTALRLNPMFNDVFHRFYQLNLDGELLEQTIQACRVAFEKNRNVAVVHSTLARLLTQQGKVDEAITSLETAIQARIVSSYPELIADDTEYKTRRPDFFVIGGMKCGTTSLFSYLCKHPKVVEPLTKEIHYFDEKFDLGNQWYFSHFASIPKGQEHITGEATPCLGNLDVIDRMKQTIPNVKLIVVLRDPTERAFSHFHHTRQSFGGTTTFANAIEKDLKYCESQSSRSKKSMSANDLQSHYLSLGFYAQKISEWLRAFPRDQFLFLRSEDLFANPQETTLRVFEFLELDAVELDEFNQENTGSYQSFASIDGRLRKRLNAFYRPHNRQLEQLLNMDFGWPVQTGKRSWFGFSFGRAA